MLNLPPSVRIFVAIEPVDMRGSFNALAGHVRRLHSEPLDGHLYFFLNRKKTLMKILWWDTNGFSIWSKRLSKGTFQLPMSVPGADKIQVGSRDLAMILQGIDLRAPRRRRYRRNTAAGS